MRPFTLGITTLAQGLFALIFFIVLIDVGSPTFNVEALPQWTGVQAAVAAIVLLTVALALGVVMHTVSRGVFHNRKQAWTLDVLTSQSVRDRFSAIMSPDPILGGPRYADILDPETPDRVRKAGAFLHGIEYQTMTRAPKVYETIQVYRDQYRLARGFVLPSAAFGIILPLWGPVAALDGAGSIGPFPIIRTQLFLLGLLAAAVSYWAFRERSYRYAAAKALAYVTISMNSDRAAASD